MKYYFESEDAGLCWPLQYFKEKLISRGLKEMKLIEAIKEPGSNYFFCKDLSITICKHDYFCGKNCDSYKPRNKRSGICNHYSNNVFYTGNEIILKL